MPVQEPSSLMIFVVDPSDAFQVPVMVGLDEQADRRINTATIAIPLARRDRVDFIGTQFGVG